MQIQDGDDAVRVQRSNKSLWLFLIFDPRIGGGGAVDAQPAVLIERDTDSVRFP